MFDIRSVFTLLAHQAEVRRICELAVPIIAEARKVAPEIMPLLRNLGIALGLLDTAQRPTKALAYVDTRWLQEALKQLGSPDLLVDGEYGDATKAAVKRFQAAHPPLEVDGWAGVQTCATVAIELEKLKGKNE